MPAIPTRYRYRRVVADGIFMSDLPVVETTLERHDRTRLARQVAVHRLDAEVPLEAPDGVRTDETVPLALGEAQADRKSTRLNVPSLMRTSYAVFCLKNKKN